MVAAMLWQQAVRRQAVAPPVSAVRVGQVVG